MKVIVNKTGDICLPWEPGLLDWLRNTYPASDYREMMYE